jgi:hypothetical protein
MSDVLLILMLKDIDTCHLQCIDNTTTRLLN